MPRFFETAPRVITPAGCLRFAVGSVVLLVGWLILTPYGHYIPPDFGRGFLKNKADYFYSSGYFLGFYAHIFSAPIALACGTLQMSRSIRIGWPSVHR